MGIPEISGKGTDDFFITIDDRIDDESEFCFFCGKEHVEVDRVIFQYSGSTER